MPLILPCRHWHYAILRHCYYGRHYYWYATTPGHYAVAFISPRLHMLFAQHLPTLLMTSYTITSAILFLRFNIYFIGDPLMLFATPPFATTPHWHAAAHLRSLLPHDGCRAFAIIIFTPLPCHYRRHAADMAPLFAAILPFRCHYRCHDYWEYAIDNAAFRHFITPYRHACFHIISSMPITPTLYAFRHCLCRRPASSMLASRCHWHHYAITLRHAIFCHSVIYRHHFQSRWLRRSAIFIVTPLSPYAWPCC